MTTGSKSHGERRREEHRAGSPQASLFDGPPDIPSSAANPQPVADAIPARPDDRMAQHSGFASHREPAYWPIPWPLIIGFVLALLLIAWVYWG